MIFLIFSVLVPIGLGLAGKPIFHVVGWALLFAAIFLGRSRKSFRVSRDNAYRDTGPVPRWYSVFLTALLYGFISFWIIAAHLGIYFLVRWLSN